jgi:hypothetical protein
MIKHDVRRGAAVYLYDGTQLGRVGLVGAIAFGVETSQGTYWIRNEALLSVEATGVYLICGLGGLARYDATNTWPAASRRDGATSGAARR